METLEKLALIFTIVGAITWGVIGLFNINIVEMIFGVSIISRIIYTIVGVCGIINIGLFFYHLKAD